MTRKESELERAFLTIVKQESLPTPQREAKLIPGRRFSFDFLFEPNVAVELQGGTWIPGMGHNTGSGIARDAEKLNLAQLEGYVVLQFTTEMVRDASFVAILRRALERKAA